MASRFQAHDYNKRKVNHNVKSFLPNPEGNPEVVSNVGTGILLLLLQESSVDIFLRFLISCPHIIYDSCFSFRIHNNDSIVWTFGRQAHSIPAHY